MKQIKTVIKPMDKVADFDEAVNQLLLDGWELKERKVIDTQGDLSEFFVMPIIQLLYAELEINKTNTFEEITL